ncbi:hypothetical protein EG68_05781 [Paragonimus skrjabini miyazakii]|uniref:Uncharacterized protein n=1 Tax=Paragonimus skrjabini miyazakii TaxID=59628 RepID=A0A8S9Z3H3_9TREM|nr:hypothetical protein EG68_05781 [Paragonimus skrjabini miyazakii]
MMLHCLLLTLHTLVVLAVSIVLTIGGALLMWNESIGARALSFNPQYTILWQSTNAEELVYKAFRNLLQLVAPAGQTYFITGIILIIFCLAALYGLLRKADIFVIIVSLLQTHFCIRLSQIFSTMNLLSCLIHIHRRPAFYPRDSF